MGAMTGSLFCSNSRSAATVVISLVDEAMGWIESLRIAIFLSLSAQPTASCRTV
jgi:hypothetical protein